jgi:hypothetical protein
MITTVSFIFMLLQPLLGDGRLQVEPKDKGIALIMSIPTPLHLYELAEQYPARLQGLLQSTTTQVKEFLKLPASEQVSSELRFVDHCEEVYRAFIAEHGDKDGSTLDADARRLDFIAIFLGKYHTEVFYVNAAGQLDARKRNGSLPPLPFSGIRSDNWLMPEDFPSDFAKARDRIRAGFYLPDVKLAPSPRNWSSTGSS